MGVVIRQSIKGTVVSYIGAAIGAITTMFIVTRVLDPEEIGLIRLLTEMATALSSLMLLGSVSMSFRFFPKFKTENNPYHRGFLAYMFLFPLVGSLLFGAMFIFGRDWIMEYYHANSPLFNRFSLYVLPLALLMTAIIVMETYATLLMRIAIPKLFREVGLRVIYVAIVLAYFFELISLKGMVVALLLQFGSLLVMNYVYLRSMTPLSLRMDTAFMNKKLFGQMLSYSLLVILMNISETVSAKIDVFMVGGELGLEFSGIYSIAMYMAVFIDMPIRSITMISQPILSTAVASENKLEIQRVVQQVSLNQFLVAGALFLALWINIDLIFHVMPNSDTYEQGKYVVLFIGLSRVITSLYAPASLTISYSKRYYLSFFWVVAMAVLTVVLNNVFIPIYGINGAALATMVTVLSIALVVLIVLRWVLKVSLLSRGIIKFFLILCGLWILNHYLPILKSPWLDSAYRSAIIGSLGLFLVLTCRVSTEFTSLVNIFFKRVKAFLGL